MCRNTLERHKHGECQSVVMGCNAVAKVSGQQLEHALGPGWAKFAVETLHCVGDESLYVLSAPQDRLHLRQFPSYLGRLNALLGKVCPRPVFLARHLLPSIVQTAH